MQTAALCPSFINSLEAFGTDGPGVKSLSFRTIHPWIQVLVLLLTSCVTSGKLLASLNFSLLLYETKIENSGSL